MKTVLRLSTLAFTLLILHAAHGQYTWTNFAGQPGGEGNADGTGTAARFYSPDGVVVDSSGNLYVTDAFEDTIRKITSAGVVTTFAGSPGTSGFTNATGSAARFNGPEGMAMDSSGNLYVADSTNYAIRKVTSAGVVTTLAGGSFGSTDGTGTAAKFALPSGVAVDSSGNVYVADEGNNKIRKITPAGVVTTFAGSGTAGSADGTGGAAQFSSPNGVAVDSSGNVWVSDSGNETIRKITSAGVVTTFAGTAGSAGTTNGTGSAARFNDPDGISVDSSGNLYVVDTNTCLIRKITSAAVVTTLAGSGAQGSTDGTGAAAQFDFPHYAAVDSSGNIWVTDTDNTTVRKVTSAGVVTTFAGSVSSPGSTNGTGSAARFNGPTATAVDSSGNVYVADSNNDTIRKITSAGVVTTLAGTPGVNGSSNGTGSAASFNDPQGIVVDSSGNLYVADTQNNTIRKITSVGVVTTFAGNPENEGGNDGTGSAAEFDHPTGIAMDSSGNLYVAENYGDTVRKITTPGAVVTTLAGSWRNSGNTDGTGSAASFSNPAGIGVDSSGNVYVADTSNNKIRKITSAGVVTTFAGSVIAGSADGTGTAARFSSPSGLAVDSSGNLYVSEEGFMNLDAGNNTIRKITSAAVVTTIGGVAGIEGGSDGLGTAAFFFDPQGICVSSTGLLYVADTFNNRISKGSISFPPIVALAELTGQSSTTASLNGTVNPDGFSTTAQFEYGPTTSYGSTASVTLTPNNDSTVHAVSTGLTSLQLGATYHYRLDATNTYGGVTTSDASFVPTGTFSPTTFTSPSTVPLTSNGFTATGSTLGTVNFSFAPTQGTAYTLVNNTGVGSTGAFTGLPQGSVVTVTYNGTVYDLSISYTGGDGNDITLTSGAYSWTNFAGLSSTAGSANGVGNAARFDGPVGAAVDSSGNIYIADSLNETIRKITSAGVVTTLAGTAGSPGSADGTGAAARFNEPEGVAVDSSGNVYVADTGNYTIRKITSAGVVTTLAGTAGSPGNTNGTGAAARFYFPNGVAVDSSGNVYVADTGNDTIRMITPAGVVTTLAGIAGFSGSTNGTGTAAQFNEPESLTVDSSGNVYVADTFNSTIRKITSSGVVTTLAGTAQTTGSTDGSGSAALFKTPEGVAVDGNGNLYVADTGNDMIRKITPSGVVTTIGGTAADASSANGLGAAALFSSPQGVTVNAAGLVYISDTTNDRISVGTIVYTSAPAIAVQEPVGTGLVSGSSTVDFGSVSTSGAASSIKTFTILNTGTGTLTLGTATVSGGNSGDFSITTPPSSSVSSGSSTTLGVTFTPQAIGSRETSLNIPSNDPVTATFTVQLTGTGSQVTTTAATAVTSAFATLNGSANPNGVSTTAYFQYGTSISYGRSTGYTSLGSGSTSVPTSFNISGLAKGATYHYRLVINSGGVISYGADQTFTTPSTASPPNWHSAQVTWLTSPTNPMPMADGARTGAAHTSSELYFYKGTDSNMWCVYLKGGSAWTQVQLTTNTNVSDWLAFEPNYGALCYQSNDGNLWCVYYSTATAKWVTEQLGTPPQGVTVAGDIVVDSSGGWNNIYYRGSDSHLYAAYLKGNTWTHVALGGTATVKGNLAVEGNNHLIYYQGTDNNIWCFYYTGKVWEQVQLSTTANVGGTVAVDSAGLLVYYKALTDNSAWCTYPVGGTTWTPVQLDATANMSTSATSFSNIAPYNAAHYNTEYLDNNGQFNAEYYNGSKWGHLLLGDGGSSLTGGLSLQPVNHWFFARRSDGNIIIFYNQ